VSRGRIPFTQAEVTRAVRGAIKGGLVVSEVRVDPEGNITVLSSGQSEQYDDPADFEKRLQKAAEGWSKRRRGRSSERGDDAAQEMTKTRK
jgi:hypothetical protein